MTDDCVFESTGPEPDGQHHDGQDAVRAVWERLFDETRDPKFTDEDAFLSGDRVCLRRRFTRTNEDGSESHVRGVDVIRFRDGPFLRCSPTSRAERPEDSLESAC
jgi:ketosteroid isomerase-like protein